MNIVKRMTLEFKEIDKLRDAEDLAILTFKTNPSKDRYEAIVDCWIEYKKVLVARNIELAKDYEIQRVDTMSYQVACILLAIFVIMLGLK